MRRVVNPFALVVCLCGAAIPAAGALAPDGAEFQINSHTTGAQLYPSVAAAGNGTFVVVWTGYDQDQSYAGVFARRFDSSGAPVGAEFQTNSFADDDQYFPAVAADTAGNFVVVWASAGQDGDDLGVFGRRFDSTGTPVDTEFQINTYTGGRQDLPDVASTPDGGFLVAWIRADKAEDNFGVFAQRYDDIGQPAGTEFQVSVRTMGYQGGVSVAAAQDGSFVVVWNSLDEDAYGIFGRYLAADGTPMGDEIQMNTYATGDQWAPAGTVDADGSILVVWENDLQDAPGSEITGQRFDPDGNAVGSEFSAHDASDAGRTSPVAAFAPAGDFLMAWSDDTTDDSSQGVVGRHFENTGDAGAGDFQINVYTLEGQSYADAAADGNGNFVVVWSSFGEDGSDFGIFGRRFSPAEAPATCVGDCSDDGAVTVDELVKGVNIALGRLAVADCPAFDSSGDGSVAVNELIQGVNSALEGCPS